MSVFSLAQILFETSHRLNTCWLWQDKIAHFLVMQNSSDSELVNLQKASSGHKQKRFVDPSGMELNLSFYS
jgi:hypothetical protein